MFCKIVVLCCAFFIFGVEKPVEAQLGGCPDTVTMPNFADCFFEGTWYAYEKNAELSEILTKCYTYEYYPSKNDVITVKSSSVSIGTGAEESKIGTAKVVQNGEAAGDNNWDYRILHTDYDNYAVVFACQPGLIAYDSKLWLLTRVPNPEQKYIDEAYVIIRGNGLDPNSIARSDQSCFTDN